MTDMADTPTSRLEGVRYGHVTRHGDRRGWFAEVWRASAFGKLREADTGLPDARFVQANLSSSAAGVLRGLHYHRRQLDYWTVLEGRVFLALVDLRPFIADPAASPLTETRELAAGEFAVVPTGVAHGFLAIEPLLLLYLTTNEYDGSDELGFAWDDPDARVDWPQVANTPDGLPILSDRDRTNPSLRALVERLRGK